MANRFNIIILLALFFIGKSTFAANCDVPRYENTRFYGQLVQSLNSIQSLNDCAFACWQLDQQSGNCKSANYFQQTCELFQDDPWNLAEGSNYQADSTSTLLVQIRCSDSDPNPQPQPQPQPQPGAGDLNIKYEPMNCEVWNYNNMRYSGILQMTLDNVDSAAICASICWQINQQGRKCNSTNYIIPEKKCEFFQDEAINGMGSGSSYDSNDATSLYIVTLNCKEPGPANNNPLPSNGNTNNIRPGSCGQTSVNPKKTRIVGGFEARKHSIPWIVSLRRSPWDNHFCGGTLIRVRPDREESDIVVTAAHCVAKMDEPIPVNVTAGAHYRFGAMPGEVNVAVARKVDHPLYSNPAAYAHDISILKLASPIKFSQTIQPACLPGDNSEEPEPGTLGIVAGWGALEENGAASGALMEVTLPVIERATCQQMYQGVYTIVPDVMLCAGYDRGQQDSCQGDSGGPYFFNGKNGFTLQGIVSFGAGCARAKAPGVYSRVTNLLDFIQQQVQALSDVYRS